ncbi:MAG: YkgJ family cysteine cluster protein, partial [Flavobacteriales bacterium]|nr:YkgJ family cysteine cluster protein [Flavobacteriales bacterium]
MELRLKAWLDHAKNKKKENKKFLLALHRNRDLDRIFHRQHEEVFAQTDCLQCANCCKTTSPIFRDVDIDRIAAHLGVRPSELTEKYLHLDEDNDWVLNSSPCVFLQEDNKCSIYEVRPRACRDYPHTDRKNMAGILELTYRNTLVCPAVARMVENLKQHAGQ